MKPSLRLITPALPRSAGGGVRMRAWQFLGGAVRSHAVTLVVGSSGFPCEHRQSAQEHLPLVKRYLVSSRRAEGPAAWVEACLRALAAGPDITAPTHAPFDFVVGRSLARGKERVAALLATSAAGESA
jgi:hypothetical protein